jgi:hypothetical protein
MVMYKLMMRIIQKLEQYAAFPNTFNIKNTGALTNDLKESPSEMLQN